MKMMLLIALGGAIGAVSRYGTSLGVHALFGRSFPYGTLVVNVLGSFIIGLLTVLLLERLTQSGALRGLLLIGFLGAFTTFSTFSYETLALFENGEVTKALVNVASSLILCLSAVWLGTLIGRPL